MNKEFIKKKSGITFNYLFKGWFNNIYDWIVIDNQRAHPISYDICALNNILFTTLHVFKTSNKSGTYHISYNCITIAVNRVLMLCNYD